MMVRTKSEARAQIAQDTQAFLQNGGKVTKLSISASGKRKKQTVTASQIDFSQLPKALRKKFQPAK